MESEIVTTVIILFVAWYAIPIAALWWVDWENGRLHKQNIKRMRVEEDLTITKGELRDARDHIAELEGLLEEAIQIEPLIVNAGLILWRSRVNKVLQGEAQSDGD